MSIRTKSNLAYFCLFVVGITFVILVKDEPSDHKQDKQKTECKPVKADSVYSTEHKAVFDYWIEIDSNRFKE